VRSRNRSAAGVCEKRPGQARAVALHCLQCSSALLPPPLPLLPPLLLLLLLLLLVQSGAVAAAAIKPSRDAARAGGHSSWEWSRECVCCQFLWMAPAEAAQAACRHLCPQVRLCGCGVGWVRWGSCAACPCKTCTHPPTHPGTCPTQWVPSSPCGCHSCANSCCVVRTP